MVLSIIDYPLITMTVLLVFYQIGILKHVVNKLRQTFKPAMGLQVSLWASMSPPDNISILILVWPWFIAL